MLTTDRWMLLWFRKPGQLLKADTFGSYEAADARRREHVAWARERLMDDQYEHTLAVVHTTWDGVNELRLA